VRHVRNGSVKRGQKHLCVKFAGACSCMLCHIRMSVRSRISLLPFACLFPLRVNSCGSVLSLYRI
jgi:hypothetical protein